MNYCIINGHKVFPAVGNNIKVTKENPLIKDRDAHTMEMEFPLAIQQNRELFGSVNRIDVAKRVTEFADCTLYANNLLVIQGKGTVTTFTDTAVKMQIVSGVRETELNDTYSKVYIDELDIYDTIVIETDDESVRFGSQYELPPVYDETNSRVINGKKYYTDCEDSSYVKFLYYNQCPQVYLSSVLHAVLRYMGYTPKGLIVSKEPWSKLLIYSAKCPSTTIFNLRRVLPHWSIKTLLSEVKKLFNCAFVFNEADKTVTMERLDDTTEYATYECLDEFTTDYEEDGLEYIGASNIEYNLSDAEECAGYDMEEDILNSFTVREYDNYFAAKADLDNLTEKEKMTSVFHYKTAASKSATHWGYVSKQTADDLSVSYVLTDFGDYMHIRREAGSDSTVTLNMVPCAQKDVDMTVQHYCKTHGKLSAEATLELSMPSSVPDSSDDSGDISSEYVSVEDYIESGDEPTERDEDERMELFFFAGEKTCSLEYTKKTFTEGTSSTTVEMKCPLGCSRLDNASLRFESSGEENCIGQFHSQAKTIENREQIVVKFLSSEIPDPKKIFIFRNKRFLCDKIEMTVKDEGIDRLMTGYFYELS